MRNKFVKAMAITLALAAALSVCGCKDNGSDGQPYEPTEPVDVERTQLYVFNDNSSYGSEWLMNAKARFEQLHAADDFWEEGKKGVQVVVKNTQNGLGTAQEILSGDDELFFVQEADYYALRKGGVIADIADVVTETLSGEERSIADKMDARQKARYGSADGETQSYYGVPTHLAYFGFVYNVDLFDAEGYYLLDAPVGAEDTEDYFIKSATDVKSAGPDGTKGTPDDGLPATYDEFFLLCDYIDSKRQTPVMWAGKDYDTYLTRLAGALAADYEGYGQTMLNYTLEGEATNLGQIVNGQFELYKESTPITLDNAYELAHQAGNYYALQFVRRLTGEDDYTHDKAYDDRHTRYHAQTDFLHAGQDGGMAPIAMLADGVWWESQAAATFASMSEENETLSKQNRRFGWLPLPKATKEQVGQGSTLIDTLNAFVFMKSNVKDWKKPLAKEFLQFLFTDESLAKYTQLTGAPTALSYTLTDGDKSQVSPFGLSVAEAKAKAETVYPYSTKEVFTEHEKGFQTLERRRAKFTLGQQQFPAAAFHDANMSVVDYFNGMCKYRKYAWSEWAE